MDRSSISPEYPDARFGTKDEVIVGYQGLRMRVRLDEKTLEYVAHLTLYFHAG